MTQAIFERLVAMADEILDFHSNGYLYRARLERQEFFEKEASERRFNKHSRFGKLWANCDYAFRVLLNPEQQASAIKAIKGTPNLEVSEENIELLKKVLEELAMEQPADVVMDAEDSEFWDELADRFSEFLLSGEVTLNEEEEYEE